MNNLKNNAVNEEKYYKLKIEGPIYLTVSTEHSSKFNNIEEWKDSFNIIVRNNTDIFTFSKNDIGISNIEGFEETTESELNLTAIILIEENFSSFEEFNIDNIELDIDSNYNFDISELSVELN